MAWVRLLTAQNQILLAWYRNRQMAKFLAYLTLAVFSLFSDFGLGPLGGSLGPVGGGGGGVGGVGMLGPPCNSNLASSQPLPSNVLSKQQSQAPTHTINQ